MIVNIVEYLGRTLYHDSNLHTMGGHKVRVYSKLKCYTQYHLLQVI